MLKVKTVTRHVVSLISVAAVAAIAVASSGASSQASLPPNGVYTCDWIAANPVAALAAHVTCSQSVFFQEMSAPPTPAEEAAAATESPDTESCPEVPNGTRVGKGVFAWSNYYNATAISWVTHVSQNYTWYIDGINGIEYAHGNSDGSDTTLTFYTYRWGAQNHSDNPNYWTVCFAY